MRASNGCDWGCRFRLWSEHFGQFPRGRLGHLVVVVGVAMRVLELLPAPAQTPAGWRHWATRMDAFCAKSAANEAERSLRTARWERVLRERIQSKVQMLRGTFLGGRGGGGQREWPEYCAVGKNRLERRLAAATPSSRRIPQVTHQSWRGALSRAPRPLSLSPAPREPDHRTHTYAPAYRPRPRRVRLYLRALPRDECISSCAQPLIHLYLRSLLARRHHGVTGHRVQREVLRR